MTDKFTYYITKPADKEPVVFDCPNCHSAIQRVIPLDMKEGQDKCGSCGCEFEWDRKEE